MIDLDIDAIRKRAEINAKDPIKSFHDKWCLKDREYLLAEVGRLRAALIVSGRNAGASLADNVSTDFLMRVPEEVRLVIERLRAQNEELRVSLVIAIRTIMVSE